jgi:hypothetical protein
MGRPHRSPFFFGSVQMLKGRAACLRGIALRIVAMEPTPNPNSMKLTLDEALPVGVILQFTAEDAHAAPPYMQQLLRIEGVRSVFQVADFIALERSPLASWREILAGARQVLESAVAAPPEGMEATGRVTVLLQMFRGLPMQIKLLSGTREVRVPLPERFKQAALQAAQASTDFLAERKWVDRGIRYGEMEEIGAEVAAEVAAAYDEDRLAGLLAKALLQPPGAPEPPRESLAPAEVARRLAEPDWRRRYAALEQLEPAPEALPVIVSAAGDANASVRRLAVVYLGDIAGDAVVPHLVAALKDPSAAVRRAAGDCLSDLGDPAAIAPMCEALQDPSKLVRWRAARYLYEVGDPSALPALEAAAAQDPEFEVALQARMAIERIESGGTGVEPAWKRLM